MFETCDCRCHDSTWDVKHCMPCCTKCEFCGRRIKYWAEESHEANCKKEFDELVKRIEETVGKQIETADGPPVDVAKTLKEYRHCSRMTKKIARRHKQMIDKAK